MTTSIETTMSNGETKSANGTNGQLSNGGKMFDANGVPNYTTSSIDAKGNKTYVISIVWRNVFLLTALHLSAIWGLYLYFVSAQVYTVYFNHFLVLLLAMGITAGAHRLWSHRSYEANFPLRVFLMILNCGMLQNDIYEWCRDHRVHHKFSETDADPHNSNRGFFFAHMGWLMCKKHEDVLVKGSTVDLSDLDRDVIVRFQRQFYKPLAMFFTFYLPSFIPYYFWGENIYTSFFLSTLRYAITLHGTWLVNSAAHMYGNRPYDRVLRPVESRLVQYSSIGEGYHNYHHVFPYDYSASELGWKYDLNVSTLFIDTFYKIGWAKNLKKVDSKIVQSRIDRTGDRELNTTYVEIRKKRKFNWDTFKVIIGFLILLPTATVLIRKSIQLLIQQFV